MKLLLIRHGDPDYEHDSLTEKGWREAALLSERMARTPVDAFYVSPLGRAKDTASLTLRKLHRRAEIKDWLQEFTYRLTNPVTGEKELPWDRMPAEWTRMPLLYEKDAFLDAPLLATGPIREKYAEVCSGLDALLAEHGYERDGNLYRAVRPNRETVALFCHFGVSCVLLSHLLGCSPYIFWQGSVAAPTSVTTLCTEERQQGIAIFRMSSFGDISHLYAGNEEPSFAARFCETYDCLEERH